MVFDRDRMLVPALSVAHYRMTFERTAGPAIRFVEMLEASDTARLADLRREFDTLAAEYLRDNVVRQDYLLTPATKV